MFIQNIAAGNKVTCLWSSTASSVGRTLDFQSNGLAFESLVGKEEQFWQNLKPENIKALSWPMRSRKNHSEPQNYRSLKILVKCSFKIYQQETKWDASDRAPLAQSGLSIQRLGVRVPCGERDTVFTEVEAGKYKNSELTNAIQKKPQWAAKLQES